MIAARISDKETIELVELDIPSPGDGEVLVRVLKCGICGSDLHTWHGKWNNPRPGHEFCGIVEECGDQVESLKPGDRVTAECFGHCGACKWCRQGDYNLCENKVDVFRPAGAFAEKIVHRAESVFKVPDSLTVAQAVLVEPLAVSFRAVSREREIEEANIVVIGGGTIGLLCAAVARAHGARRVFSIAKYDHQAEMADRMGATDVLRLGQDDPRQRIEEITEGRGADLVVDAVAAGTSFTTALSIARKRGKVVVVGGATRPLLSGIGPLIWGELMVTGSSCYATTEGRRDFEWALELTENKEVCPEPIITHTFSLDEISEAFQAADDKETGAIKVVVDISDR